MGQIHDNITSLHFWKSWSTIVLGCFIMATGFVLFINPYNIVPGGVYGASIVLHYIFPAIKVGTFGYMFDIPLLIISAILLGTKFGACILVMAHLTRAIMNIMTLLFCPDAAAIEILDRLYGFLDFSYHLI